jgi:carbon storage regulator
MYVWSLNVLQFSKEWKMLVLSRRKEQRIKIGVPGNVITIVITDIRGESVRIGFDADKGTPIHREEVYNKIHGIEGEGI